MTAGVLVKGIRIITSMVIGIRRCTATSTNRGEGQAVHTEITVITGRGIPLLPAPPTSDTGTFSS